MPTKDELEQENAELRAEVQRLSKGGNIATTGGVRPKPARPVDADGDPVLSAGEHADLEMHGVTISPFTGETLNALDEGVTPGNPEARRRAEEERAARQRREDTLGDPRALAPDRAEQ